jgi:hypothetical protein
MRRIESESENESESERERERERERRTRKMHFTRGVYKLLCRLIANGLIKFFAPDNITQD